MLKEEKSAWPKRMMPPMMITPLMAFAPDIKGVCNTDGTLEMTSMPRKMERAMIKMISLCS
jgi:hypothetical protein